MWEGAQWVDVGKEVIHEEIQRLYVADGFGRDGRMRGMRRQSGQSLCGMSGRGWCGLATDVVWRLLETATLDCFCMTVGRTATATRTFEGAGNV